MKQNALTAVSVWYAIFEIWLHGIVKYKIQPCTLTELDNQTVLTSLAQ